MARYVDNNACSNNLSCQRGPGCSRNERSLSVVSKPDKLTNVLLILRKRDCQRHFAVNRGIGGIQSPRRVIKMELAFQFGGEALKLSRIRGHWQVEVV